MTLAGRIRARAYAAAIQRREGLQRVDLEADLRARIQLEILNAEWQRTIDRVPYFRALRQELSLPVAFASLEEFCSRVPATTRETLQHHGARLAVEGARAEFWRTTGGSTSRPVQIPAWRSEVAHTMPDLWVGRRWYGVGPEAPLFLLWGHSHLLGAGWRGRVNAARRVMNDRLLGYRRFSAYDLRPEALRRAADALLDAAPRYVIGYSVALDLFARVNRDRAAQFAGLGLAAAIGTAEAFPGPDSADLVSAVLGAPVGMEYGAVETGVVAHTHPEGGYRVFWRTHLVEAERGAEGRHLLRVTSLYPRCLPLVRYELGDEIELDSPAAAHAVGLTRFRRVVGRCNDYVPLASGSRVHSEAFSHALRPCEEVRSFRVVHRARGVQIQFTSDAPLSERAAIEIRERLRRIDAQLGAVDLVRVPVIPQTTAGKTRMVVAE